MRREFLFVWNRKGKDLSNGVKLVKYCSNLEQKFATQIQDGELGINQ